MLNMYTRTVETGYAVLAAVSPCNAWSHFRILQANQWFPYTALAEIRWKKLHQLLLFSYEHIPFYQRIWRN